MTAKDRDRIKIIEFIGNPENEFPNRKKIAMSVCGYKDQHYLYKVFTVDELNQIENEALQIRRKRVARFSAAVDRARLDAATTGDVSAMKLFYQKFENWSEKRSIDLNKKVDCDIAGVRQKLLDRLDVMSKQREKRKVLL
jgi:hypothetical protein